MRTTLRLMAAVAIAGLAATGAACDETTSQPSRFEGILVTETFSGTLQPSGEAFYSFSMSVAGTVSLTLVSMTGPAVPGDAMFPIGIGMPVGTGCTAGVDAAVQPGASPQYRETKEIGVYCVRIADNARLGAPATFALNITHPR